VEGFTSQPVQKIVGISRLTAAVLFESGRLENNGQIQSSDFLNSRIETELGYRLNKTINEEVSIDEVRNLVNEVVAVVEILDASLEDLKNITAVDFIAANTFSSHFMIDNAPSVNKLDPNIVVVTLFHEDTLSNQGLAVDALGDQWKALSQLINKVVLHGYEIRASEILITGALGFVLQSNKGEYTANFGNELGQIKFEIH